MALGKGLGEILEEVGQAYEHQEMIGGKEGEESSQGIVIEELDVNNISANPYQPRKNFDKQALQELSESIQSHGLLQPIVVLEKEDGYLLVAGERRLRAHKLAKIEKIRAVIADVDIDSIRLRELALIENIQRENLNAIELANSYAELIEVHSITHDELSTIVHKSRSQITNTMRLLTLDSYVQKLLLDGKVSQGHAKILVGLDEDRQKVIADTIVGQKLNVRETENLVKRHKKSNVSGEQKSQADSWLLHYRDMVKQYLPFKHHIKANKLEISFRNETELKDFMEIIKRS